MPFAPRRVVRRAARRNAGSQSAAAPAAAGRPGGTSPGRAAAPAEPAYMAELQQLNELKTQGVISEEEFEAKKQQILGL